MNILHLVLLIMMLMLRMCEGGGIIVLTKFCGLVVCQQNNTQPAHVWLKADRQFSPGVHSQCVNVCTCSSVSLKDVVIYVLTINIMLSVCLNVILQSNISEVPEPLQRATLKGK